MRHSLIGVRHKRGHEINNASLQSTEVLFAVVLAGYRQQQIPKEMTAQNMPLSRDKHDWAERCDVVTDIWMPPLNS